MASAVAAVVDFLRSARPHSGRARKPRAFRPGRIGPLLSDNYTHRNGEQEYKSDG